MTERHGSLLSAKKKAFSPTTRAKLSAKLKAYWATKKPAGSNPRSSNSEILYESNGKLVARFQEREMWPGTESNCRHEDFQFTRHPESMCSIGRQLHESIRLKALSVAQFADWNT
jgi:hypothetical protein